MEDFKINELKVGDIVDGTVFRVTDNEVNLDLGHIYEGTIYKNQYTYKDVTSLTELVAVGDVIQATVKKIDEEHQVVLLSRKDIIARELEKEKETKFLEFVEEFNAGKTVVEGKVKLAVKVGLILEYNEFEMFMHESQVDFGSVNLNDYIGKTLEVKISEVDAKKQKIKVSRKALLIAKERENRKDEFETLTEGQIIKCKVIDIKEFGAIVSLEYNQALLPISELAHYRVESVDSILKIDDELEVKIIEVTRKKGKNRIRVSLKALAKTPFELYDEEFNRGSTVIGKVVNKLPFGLIIELAKGVNGLLHNNEISWNPNDNFKASVVVGDEMEVQILEINSTKQRVSLSKKYLEDNPWGKVTVKRGDTVTGIVTEIIPSKGFSVAIQGVDAFLSAELVSEVIHGKLEDMLTVGEEIEVKIIKCYPREWVLEVSAVDVTRDRERKEFDKYILTQEKSKVTLGDLFKDILNKKK